MFPAFLFAMTATQYRRERVKEYRAVLTLWKILAIDMPELLTDIADLEKHVNQITGVAVEREQSQRGGRKRIAVA